MKRLTMFLVAALFIAGCGGGSTPPPAPTGITFDVPAGQAVDKPITGMALDVPSGTFPTGSTVNVVQTSATDKPATTDFTALPDGEIVISTPKAPQADPLIDLSNRSRTTGYQYFTLFKDTTWHIMDQFSDAAVGSGKLAIDKTKFVWDGATYKVKVLVGKIAIIDIVETTNLLERGSEDIAAPADRALVAVHGFNDHAESLDTFADTIRLQHKYRHIYSLQYDWRRDGASVAQDLGGYLDQLHQQGYLVDLVGHSRGGLICRYTLERLGKTEAVTNYISVCTPNEGSTWANVEGLMRYLQEDFLNRPGSDQPWGLAAYDTPALDELVPNSSFLNSLNDSTTMWQRGYVNNVFIAANNGTNSDGVVSVPSALAQNEARGAFTAGTVSQYTLPGWHNMIRTTSGAQAIIAKMPSGGGSGVSIWTDSPTLNANLTNGWGYTVRISYSGTGSILMQDLAIDAYNYYGQWSGVCWYYEYTPANEFYPGGYTVWNQSMSVGQINLDMTTYSNIQYDPLYLIPMSDQARTEMFTLRYRDANGVNCEAYAYLKLGYNGLWPADPITRTRNRTVKKPIPVGPRQK